MTPLPEPAGTRGLGHLARWTFEPVALLTEGAALGPVFRLRLWRPVVVGYRPEWNRAVLGDLDTFRARGSLSGLTPYLSAGVVHADPPSHDDRRDQLNPHFHRRTLAPLTDRMRAAVGEPPGGRFDAVEWAGHAVRRMLNAAFFAGTFPDPLLATFLAPLQRRPPAPLLPRPVLFRRMNRALAAAVADPPPDTITGALAGLDTAVEDIRVALAAGYDTTAHTLAWLLWHLAAAPGDEATDRVVDETLRLYPAGWIGSRVATRDVEVTGVRIPAGTLVMYSPYLTHRAPDLWSEPDQFAPQRFAAGRPAWGYVPFSAGRRTCLGAHLARQMLQVAAAPFGRGRLRQVSGDPTPRPSISLRPAGPLLLDHVTGSPAVACDGRSGGAGDLHPDQQPGR